MYRKRFNLFCSTCQEINKRDVETIQGCVLWSVCGYGLWMLILIENEFVFWEKEISQRSTILAEPVVAELREHIDRVMLLLHNDLDTGFGEVYIPEALARKYSFAICHGKPAGSMFLTQKRSLLIANNRLWTNTDVITLWSQVYKKLLSNGQRIGPELTNGSPVIPCAIALPQLCWKTAPIFGCFRSFWATPM
ncbi:hypothetical protein GMJAKD_08175 [Candidatus Electrothrix aarhusensis]